jgi:CRP/FNR family transcriptional regulator
MRGIETMSVDVVEKIKKQFSTYPKRTYPKGQIILFADENPTHIYYVVSGKVRVFAISYRGDEVIANIFSSGAFFPMSWAINNTPNTYFYKTEVDTTVHVIPPEDARKFLRDNPDVLMDLLGRVYRGVDGLLGRVVHLMSGSAHSRLMYELLIEAKRFGEIQKNGTIKLGVNEQDLAARAGMSRETVSREMKKLKSKKLLSIGTHGGITILSIADLEASLTEEP